MTRTEVAPSSARPWTFRPQDDSPPGRIQRFLLKVLIQLKPKNQGAKRRVTKGRNVQKLLKPNCPANPV